MCKRFILIFIFVQLNQIKKKKRKGAQSRDGVDGERDEKNGKQ